MSAESLAVALAAAGLRCAIEARERLAVLRPVDASPDFSRADVRAAVLELLGAHGFTHAALELESETARAAPESDAG